MGRRPCPFCCPFWLVSNSSTLHTYLSFGTRALLLRSAPRDSHHPPPLHHHYGWSLVVCVLTDSPIRFRGLWVPGVNLSLTPRASKNNEPGQTIYIDHRGLISSFKRMSCEKNPPKKLRAIVPQSQHSSPTCRGRRRASPRQVVAPCTSHTARTVVLSISAGLPRVCGAGRDGLRSTARSVNRGFIG